MVVETGDVKENRDYDPWGVPMDQRQYVSGDKALEQFSGQELDDQTGWYHFGQRDLMAIYGRWPSPDRFEDKYPSHSPYSYALNDPVRFVDVNGDTVRVYIETEGVGHVWLSTGEGDNTTVYTFGRYAGTDEKSHGINTISDGPGVLVKLEGEDALAYNQEKSYKTEVFVFKIMDVDDETVAKVMDDMFNSSSELPERGAFKDDPRTRVVNDYKLLSNNCTTVVCGALNQAGSDALKKTLINPAGPSIHTYKENIVVPASLLRFLRQAEGVKSGN